jgi:hypothetical protein
MIYEAVNFYPASVEGKSEAEFIAHEKHSGLSEKQLREVYALMNPKKPSRLKKVEDNDSSLSVEKDIS